jgi:hypothetical protein
MFIDVFDSGRGFVMILCKRECMNCYFLFSWKVDGKVSRIDLHLSDKRIIEIVKVFQSISLPESTPNDTYEIQVYFIIILN